MLTIRPFQPSDIGGVVALLKESLAPEAIDEAKFARQVLLDPNLLPKGALVAEALGESTKGGIAGFLLAIARQAPNGERIPDRERGYITLFAVHPDQRGKGVGGTLLEEAEVFFITQNRREIWVSPYSPGYFTPGVDVAAYAEGLAFLKKRGFEEVTRPVSMETTTEVAAPAWVVEKEQRAAAEGVRFEAWRPELTLPLLAFAGKEFSPDWTRYVREAVEGILRGDPSERLWVAWTEGGDRKPASIFDKEDDTPADWPRVLGFSHFDGERFGPIGVAASERGRGIGQALMFKTLASQEMAGAKRSYFLWSDDKTADRLYQSAGFREVRRFAVLKKLI